MGTFTINDPLAGQSFYPSAIPSAADKAVEQSQPDIQSQLMNIAHAFMPAPKVKPDSPHWMQFVSQAMQQAQAQMDAQPRKGPSMAGTYPGLAGTTQVTPEDAARIAQVGIERMKLEQGFAGSQDQNAYRRGMMALEQRKQAADEAKQAATPDPMQLEAFHAIANALTQQNTQEQMNKYEQMRQLAVAKQNAEYQNALRGDERAWKSEENLLNRQSQEERAREHNETMTALKGIGGDKPERFSTQVDSGRQILINGGTIDGVRAAYGDKVANALVGVAPKETIKTPNTHQEWRDAEAYRLANLKAAQDGIKNIGKNPERFGQEKVSQPGAIFGNAWTNTVDNPEFVTKKEAERQRLLGEIAKWSTPTPLPSNGVVPGATVISGADYFK